MMKKYHSSVICYTFLCLFGIWFGFEWRRGRKIFTESPQIVNVVLTILKFSKNLFGEWGRVSCHYLYHYQGDCQKFELFIAVGGVEARSFVSRLQVHQTTDSSWHSHLKRGFFSPSFIPNTYHRLSCSFNKVFPAIISEYDLCWNCILNGCVIAWSDNWNPLVSITHFPVPFRI